MHQILQESQSCFRFRLLVPSYMTCEKGKNTSFLATTVEFVVCCCCCLLLLLLLWQYSRHGIAPIAVGIIAPIKGVAIDYLASTAVATATAAAATADIAVDFVFRTFDSQNNIAQNQIFGRVTIAHAYLPAYLPDRPDGIDHR